MKLKTLLLTTALVTSTALNAFADAGAPVAKKHHNHHGNKMESYYGKIEAGVTMPRGLKATDEKDNTTSKPKFKVGPVVGLGGGYRFNEFFRSDLMLQYRQAKVKQVKMKIRSYGAMLNGYVDGHNDTIFTPYVMAGVGVDAIKFSVSGSGSSKAKVKFAWNAGLGAQAKVADQLSVDLGYRYVALGKPAKGVKAISTNEVLAGLIWSF